MPAALSGSILYGLGGIQAPNFVYKGLIVLATLLGAVFTLAPSLLVLPLTANHRVKCLTGLVLEKLGDITDSLLEIFIQVNFLYSISACILEEHCLPRLVP